MTAQPMASSMDLHGCQSMSVDLHKMLLLKIGQSAAIRGARALSPVHQHFIQTRAILFTRYCSTQWHHILAVRQKLLAAVSRLFYRETPRLPLDAKNLSAMIANDVTVFTYRNKRFFMLLTIFGGMQFLCWANIAAFVVSDPTAESSGRQDTKLEKNDVTSMGKFYAENRPKIAATCFSLGILLLIYFNILQVL